jgi:hypothetical protein
MTKPTADTEFFVLDLSALCLLQRPFSDTQHAPSGPRPSERRLQPQLANGSYPDEPHVEPLRLTRKFCS